MSVSVSRTLRRVQSALIPVAFLTVGSATGHAQWYTTIGEADDAGYYELFELRNGLRLYAHLERVYQDTVYLELPDSTRLQYPGEFITHGIFDVPSQGVWRPRRDQRRLWSLRVLVDGNLSRAEYSSEELRAGGQLKVAALRRLGDRFLAGPFVGFAAMRAFHSERLAPVGLRGGIELNNRISFYTDAGYGLPVARGEQVTYAGGGIHLHPRLTVRASHPYNQFNVEFGFGYLYQRARFDRYAETRFIGETIFNPGIPGDIQLDIPYRRFSLSASFTFW